MKVAISGSTGFLGKSLALELTRQNHEVVHITRNPSKCRLIFGEGIELLDLNQEDEALLARARIFGVEVVIHTATHFSRSRKISELQEILAGTLMSSIRIFEVSRQLGATFVNFNSTWQTSAESQLSGTPYAASKEAFKLYVKQSNRDEEQVVRNLFVPETFGPGDTRGKLIEVLLEAHRSGIEPTINHPDNKVDLAYAPALSTFIVSEIPRLSELPPELEIVHYSKIRVGDLRDFILSGSFKGNNHDTKNFDLKSKGSNKISPTAGSLQVVHPPSPPLSQALCECY
jgi:nucleoside-diphosphate-sugar epimerase